MKSQIRKLILCAVLAFGASSTFAAHLIKVGPILPATGPAAVLGNTETIQLYVEKTNKGGDVVIVEPVKKFAFKTPHTDRMVAKKVFEDMYKHNITKVARLSETSGFGQSGKKEAEGVVGKYGITLVANET